MPEARAPLVELLVAFGRELRAAGLAVGSGDILDYCSAMAPLDPSDLLGGAGSTELDPQLAHDTLGAVVKERDDLDVVRDNLEEITSGA